VEVVPFEIVRCRRCGSRNRILKQKRPVTYRCGGCATQLENPFAQKSRIKHRIQGITRAASSPVVRKYTALLVVGILVVVAVLQKSDERQQAPRGLSNSLTPSISVKTSSEQPAPSLETPAVPPRSLENGTILIGLTERGPGKFTIQNDTRLDAVVKLVDELRRHSVVAVYVRAYGTTTIDGIPEGSFVALSGQGVDWDDIAKVFKREKSFGRFNQYLDFTTRVEHTEHQTIYRNKFVTLEIAPSFLGNITQSEISESAFSEY
jgi:hypothetical protein